MNLSQLAGSDARREEAQLRVRHHATLIAGIVCRIWQGRTRIGPSVRQRPPRFSNITESVGCLHVPHQVVPGTFVDYTFLFFLFSASGGWVKIKLELPHFHLCIRYMSCFDSTHDEYDKSCFDSTHDEYDNNADKAEQSLSAWRGAGRSSRGTKPLLLL